MKETDLGKLTKDELAHLMIVFDTGTYLNRACFIAYIIKSFKQILGYYTFLLFNYLSDKQRCKKGTDIFFPL